MLKQEILQYAETSNKIFFTSSFQPLPEITSY